MPYVFSYGHRWIELLDIGSAVMMARDVRTGLQMIFFTLLSGRFHGRIGCKHRDPAPNGAAMTMTPEQRMTALTFASEILPPGVLDGNRILLLEGREVGTVHSQLGDSAMKEFQRVGIHGFSVGGPSGTVVGRHGLDDAHLAEIGLPAPTPDECRRATEQMLGMPSGYLDPERMSAQTAHEAPSRTPDALVERFVARESSILTMAGYDVDLAQDMARRNCREDAVLERGEAVLLAVLEGSSTDVDDEGLVQRVAGVKRIMEAIERGEVEGGIVSFTRIERPLESWEDKSHEEISERLRGAGVPDAMTRQMASMREATRERMIAAPRTLVDTVIVGRDFAVARVSNVEDGVVVHESQHYVAHGGKMTMMLDVIQGAGSISPDAELAAARLTVDALEGGGGTPGMVADTRQYLALATHASAEARVGRHSERIVAGWLDANRHALEVPISPEAVERASALLPPRFHDRLEEMARKQAAPASRRDAMMAMGSSLAGMQTMGRC